MSELWFTKEQIEKEAASGKFNSSNIERIFRYRITQDWLTMYGQIERLQAELERVRATNKTSIEVSQDALDLLRNQTE
jgi:hypothetical protein